MTTEAALVPDLNRWLRHIASVNAREIELGLDRVGAVARRMELGKPAQHCIIIAGTNGKGSCAATVEAVLIAAGIDVFSYTSPHIHRFNERFRYNGLEADDASLCQALAAIDGARDDIPLSYFEFATLAALYLCRQWQPRVAVLEVGLGGRLDAVNIVDGDVCLITSISLDHQDWLGDDLDGIAGEKAGILRGATPAVCVDCEPSAAIRDRARELNATLYIQGRDFALEPAGPGWTWAGHSASGLARRLTGLPAPRLAPVNIAAALQALNLLPLELPDAAITRGLSGLSLPGRQEWRRDAATGVSVLLDVAHNPAAVELLAGNLRRWRRACSKPPRIAVVMAVMADKDIEGMALALESLVDIWYIAQVQEPRCLPATELLRRLESRLRNRPILPFDDVESAYRNACEELKESDLLVVTGSFHTVAAIRDLSEADCRKQS